jgi:hypothetical protein
MAVASYGSDGLQVVRSGPLILSGRASGPWPAGCMPRLKPEARSTEVLVGLNRNIGTPKSRINRFWAGALKIMADWLGPVSSRGRNGGGRRGSFRGKTRLVVDLSALMNR